MLFKIARLLLSPAEAGSAAPVTPAADKGATPAAATPPAAEPAKNDDPFADLDAAIAPTPKKDKPAADPKAEDPKTPAVDPKAKPADAQPADKGDKTFTTPKALREAHEKQVAENKRLNESIKTMEAKITAAEEQGKSTAKLNERLAALEKERDEARATVRLLKFEASDEFKNKYDKPFNRAVERTKALVEGLQITEKDSQGEDQTRAATWNDFEQLWAMPKAKSIPLVNSMFGQTAPIVLQELLSLQKMNLDRTDALDEERTQWKAREAEEKAKSEKEIAERNRQREQAQELWVKLNQDIAEKNPEYFLPDPKDKKSAEILEKALAVVDSRHNADTLTLQQRVHLDARVRLQAAGYHVALYKLNQARERIAELETAAEEAKASSPGDTLRPGGSADTEKAKTFTEELAEAKF